MAQKKWVIGLSSFLLIVLLFVGYMALAAELGSRDDPLVTQSYIADELLPGLNKKIDDAIAAKTKDYSDEMNAQYDKLMTELEKKIASLGQSFSGDLNDPAFIEAVAAAVIAKQGGSGGAVPADTMKRVDVESGKTVKLNLGSEVLLRLGSATVVASGTPGLIDMTAGTDLANGKSLEANHLYMATVDGRGFKTTAKTTVFIRGGYTVG